MKSSENDFISFTFILPDYVPNESSKAETLGETIE